MDSHLEQIIQSFAAELKPRADRHSADIKHLYHNVSGISEKITTFIAHLCQKMNDSGLFRLSMSDSYVAIQDTKTDPYLCINIIDEENGSTFRSYRFSFDGSAVHWGNNRFVLQALGNDLFQSIKSDFSKAVKFPGSVFPITPRGE